MKTTQKEIAKKVGVSQSTVSYVLSGSATNNISRETKEKILFLAGEMHYQKRFVPARNNRRSTNNIGYFIPPLKIEHFADDPYYTRFLSGLTHHAENDNFHIVMYNKYSHLLQAILDNVIDGVIVEARIGDKEAEYLKSRIPSVLLNWKTVKVLLDSVMPDNVGGIKKTVFHLFSLGHRNIAFFGSEPLYLHSKERVTGYIEGIRECGLEMHPEYMRLPEIKRGGTAEEIEELSAQALQFWRSLKNRPTAVVVIGDTYALPFLKTANRLNFKLPEELSITGFDNRTSCIYSSPSLTSIEQPMEEMAKKSLVLLSERMNNPDKPIENVILDVELIKRESTCENKEEGFAEPKEKKSGI